MSELKGGLPLNPSVSPSRERSSLPGVGDRSSIHLMQKLNSLLNSDSTCRACDKLLQEVRRSRSIGRTLQLVTILQETGVLSGEHAEMLLDEFKGKKLNRSELRILKEILLQHLREAKKQRVIKYRQLGKEIIKAGDIELQKKFVELLKQEGLLNEKEAARLINAINTGNAGKIDIVLNDKQYLLVNELARKQRISLGIISSLKGSRSNNTKLDFFAIPVPRPIEYKSNNSYPGKNNPCTTNNNTSPWNVVVHERRDYYTLEEAIKDVGAGIRAKNKKKKIEKTKRDEEKCTTKKYIDEAERKFPGVDIQEHFVEPRSRERIMQIAKSIAEYLEKRKCQNRKLA